MRLSPCRVVPLAILLSTVAVSPARPGTATYTVQSTAATTDDSYLKQDNAGERNGTKPELRLKATNDQHNRHTIVRMPLPAIGARTVLQAWMRLTVSGASSSIPLESRVYALQETWDEVNVSWGERVANVNWATPGGTHGPGWSGRALPSSANTGGQVSWSVGPILNAWQRGAIPNHGVVFEADRGAPDREVVLRSSEYTNDAAATPQLVVYATDERPAIVDGSAEIQPRAVHFGATGDPLNVWLDVTASGSTPSGQATGFDTAVLNHAGQIAAVGLDGVWVNGLKQLSLLVSWYDNGSSVTVQFPRVTGQARVRVALRVKVLADPSGSPIELPVLVDDSTTPGAWAQSVWAADADGIPGNGDDWLVAITNLPPVGIDLKPDTAAVVSSLTLPLQTYGRDAQGNVFSIVPDSVQVVPAARGTATPTLFTAGSPGTGLLVARFGPYRDTSNVTVVPPRLPGVTQLLLKTLAGVETTTLSPRDSMMIAADVGDGDGFQDIVGLDVDLSEAGHASDAGQPAFHAVYQWRRGGSPGWTLGDPSGSSWTVVPGLSVIDTVTNSTAPQAVTLGFVPGRIARASSTGSWTVRVRTYSTTPPDTSVFTFGGFDVASLITMTVADTIGIFSSGRPGTIHLPLRLPAEGGIGVEVVSNTSWSLEAGVTHMRGDSSVTDTLFVGPPTPRIAWAFNSGGTGGGWLDTTLAGIGPSMAAPTTEAPTARKLHLWLDIPGGLPPQDYRGPLRLRTRESDGSFVQSAVVPLVANVADAGQAATSALAEVRPEQAQAGTAAAEFDAWALPNFQAGDSGVDRLLVTLPPAWGTPVVTSVTVGGLPVAAADSSAPRLVRVALSSRVTTVSLVNVHFRVSVPTELDSTGSGFPVQFDDSATPIPPQAATEGDANGVADGDDWLVRVVAGPVATLAIDPDPAACYLDSTLTFSAAARDAYGHPTTADVGWSVLDPVGTIDAEGVFTGTAMGIGRVVAQSGTVRDTAIVTVRPVRALAIRAVEAPTSAYQGQRPIPVRVRIENIGAENVTLDSLRVRFRRSSGAAADADYALVTGDPLPASLPSGASLWAATEWQAGDNALIGRITVDARVAGKAGSYPIVDDGADTAAAFDLLAGGLVMTATQSSTSARPGVETVSLTLALENRYPVGRRVMSIGLANITSGPGDVEQRDAEVGDVRVYRDDGDAVFEPGSDTLLVATVALGGGGQLDPLGLGLPPGATARLFVTVRPSLRARDGDVIDWRIAGPASVAFDSTTLLRNGWPLDPPGGCTVDGLVAAQVALLSSGAGSAPAGLADRHALSMLLPPNGYTTDVLEQLTVGNLGTARVGTDIARIRAWADDGDGVFGATSDRLLGALAWTGARWQLSGLTEPVPLSGLVVHYTVDVPALAENGRTIRLTVPSGAYPGIGMQSGDSGPLDVAIDNPLTMVVTTNDRLTFASALVAPPSVAPGAREVPILHLTAANSYASPRSITAIALTNDAHGTGTPAEVDRTFEVLALRIDGNDNGTLDDLVTDPVAGVGSFAGGRVVFDGLNWTVQPGMPRSLFVTADVSTRDAADGDSIGVTLAGAADVAVLEPTSILGAWPLGGGRAAVNGMVGAQLTLQPLPAVTLAPGDGPVRALDLIVPRNGYSGDILEGVRVANLGSAAASDLAELRLWRDGGDGQFGAGGDDLDLGAMVSVPGGWQSVLLSEPLGPLGARLYVAATISGSPSDSATLRLAVPLQGIAVRSGNDGPCDVPVANPETMLLSTAPLVASIATVPRASTIGQVVQVRLVVRNVGGETVEAVRPSAPVVGGTATLTPLTGPVPDFLDLASAQSDTFTWTYRADVAGTARVTSSVRGLGNPSGIQRRSLEATSDQHQVFASVGTLAMLAVQSMPATVRAGQVDVVPFSLTFRNPAGPEASDALVRGLVIRLEDQASNGIIPSDLVKRAVVSEGVNVYLVKTAVDSTGTDLVLPLATPITVTPEQPTTVSLRLDLRAATSVPTFRAVVAAASSVEAEDATSGTPVAVMASPSYPLRSGVARVVAEATVLDVRAAGGSATRVTRGATSVAVLDLSLRSSGLSGVSSDVRVNALRVLFEDTTGVAIGRPQDRLSRLVLLSGAQVLATRTLGDPDSAGALVWLNPPLNVPVNTDVPLLVLGDVRAASPLGAFRVRLGAPATTSASDANTGNAVPVTYTTSPAAGAPVTVEAAAETLLARGAGRLPAGVAVGRAGLLAIEATLRHPHVPGTARIRLESLRVRCRDEARTPLAPSAYLSAVRIRWNGADAAAVTSVPADPSGLVVPMPATLLEPGDSGRVELVVDLSPAAPASLLELEIAATGIVASEANSGAPIRVEPAAGFELPLLSGLTRIVPAARDLSVGLASAMPAVLVGDGREVVAGTLQLSNDAGAGAGTITIDGLVLRAGDAAFAPVALGAAVSRVSSWRGDTLWAQSAPLLPDSATAVLIPLAPLDLAPGVPVGIELRFVTRSGATGSGLRLGLDAADVGVVQPVSGALAVNVRPAAGRTFPLWTEIGNLTDASLAGSCSNFPNPFAAGREPTTFSYWLRSPATVTLRLWTLRNEAVRTILDGVARPAGMQQTDLWDGRNGRGDVVRNGVYVADLTVRYGDGSQDRVLRKVAVVR